MTHLLARDGRVVAWSPTLRRCVLVADVREAMDVPEDMRVRIEREVGCELREERSGK